MSAFEFLSKIIPQPSTPPEARMSTAGDCSHLRNTAFRKRTMMLQCSDPISRSPPISPSIGSTKDQENDP
jgi:hypothetical protein